MKFLCDRCKTRYSIADERVRGKILKIRCKNCANVISVREGMTDEDLSPPAPAASGSALQNAFANVMVGTRPGETQPPPPVLEEEWYVAIDGNQSGPFSLAEAQVWVGGKPLTEDLYCWCEGFDDWLPVEKVSHFRGLRGAPRSKTPTAAPSARGAVKEPAAASASRPVAKAEPAPPPDEDPKPLFAATLAKLEAESPSASMAAAAKRDASKPVAKVAAPQEKLDKPVALDKLADKAKADRSKPAEKAPASLTPLAPRVTDLGGAAGAAAPPTSPRAPLPMPNRNASGPVAAGGASAPSLARGAQAAVASAAPATALAGPLAKPELPKPLAKPELPKPEPLARPEALAKPAPLPAPTPPARPAAAMGGRRPMFDTGEPDPDPVDSLDDSALQDDDGDGTDGLDLDIGEVSRVVRLPDLMAGAGRATGRNSAARAAQRSTGGQQAIARGTGAVPALAAAAGAAALGGGAMGADALPPLSDSALADAQPALVPSVAHRTNHQTMWMIGGAVLLLGIIVVVAVAASSGSGAGEDVSTGGNLDVTGLGYTYDPLRPHGGGTDDGAGTGSVAITGVHVIKRPINNGNNGNNGSQQIGTNVGTGRQEIGPNGEPILPLTGDDIIQVSQKNSMGTGRCYDRALKKDPFLVVQKIQVSLKVDVNGVVTDVSLDSHASDDLGQCLSAAIRRWGFRKSTEGINTVFPLVFQQGP